MLLPWSSPRRQAAADGLAPSRSQTHDAYSRQPRAKEAQPSPLGCVSPKRSGCSAKGKGLVYEEPKADRSRRTLALPEQVVDALETHRAAQAKERLRAGTELEDPGAAFRPGERPTGRTRRAHRRTLRPRQQLVTNLQRQGNQLHTVGLAYRLRAHPAQAHRLDSPKRLPPRRTPLINTDNNINID